MASLAERYREHRAAFSLAQELRCTPAEAVAELKRRAARERWEATRVRLESKMAPSPLPVPIDGHEEATAPGRPWMMED